MQCKASTRHPKCRLHITYIVNVPLGRLILLKNVLLPTPQDPQQRFRYCKSTASLKIWVILAGH